MLVYIGVFLVAVTVSRVAEYAWDRRDESALPRRVGFGMLVVIAVLAGVSALRWRVGTDYWNYEWLFPGYAEQASRGLDLLGEPGIRVIAWLAMSTTGDSATMFAIAAVITIGLTVRTLWRWSPAFAFSIALYIVSGAWHGSFNGIRQYLACAILFAGHRYLIDRRAVRWLAVVAVASLFHLSAAVALLLYLVPTKRTSIGIQAVIIALGFVGMLGLDSVLEFLSVQTGDAQVWDGSYANRALNPLRVAFAFLPIILFWAMRNRKAIAEASAWFYVNMLVVYAAIYLASASSAYIARFAIYALPFVSLGVVWATAVPDRRERVLARGSVLLIFAVFLFLEISGTKNLQEFQWLFQRP